VSTLSEGGGFEREEEEGVEGIVSGRAAAMYKCICYVYVNQKKKIVSLSPLFSVRFQKKKKTGLVFFQGFFLVFVLYYNL